MLVTTADTAVEVESTPEIVSLSEKVEAALSVPVFKSVSYTHLTLPPTPYV